MQKVKVERTSNKVKVNINSIRSDYFTEQERQDFINGKPCEAEVIQHHYTVHLRTQREFIEKLLGLRPLLKTIQKLSKEQGAMSKQLFKYYEKVGISTLSPHIKKVYTPIRKVDLNDLSNRQDHFSDVCIHIGTKEYYGIGKHVEDAAGKIAQDHLKRCIAILANKGYITITNQKRNRTMKGNRYTYSFTYYKLTDKANQLLSKMK